MKRISDIPVEKIKEVIASSNTFREAIRKLGYTGQGGAYRTFRKVIERENIDYSHMTHYVNKPKYRDISTIFINGSDVSSSTLRKAVLRNTNIEYKCAICGLQPQWNNKPLSLTLDHINGNHNDNRIENLRFVCPNCDRQLETFGSKNRISYYKSPVFKKSNNPKVPKFTCIDCGVPVWTKNSRCKSCNKKYNKRNFPSIEELNVAIKMCNSFVELGKYFLVSDNAMRKRFESYNIPTNSKGYRKFREKLINGEIEIIQTS